MVIFNSYVKLPEGNHDRGEALEVSETPGLVPPANNGPKILIQSFPQRKNAAPTNPSCTNQLLSACAVQSQLVVSTDEC
jgi:hypothetical protein